MKENTSETKKSPLAIYIHIPFCVKKCYYCDFLSGRADVKLQQAYIEALRNEIKENETLAQEYEVKTIFIGGGTPSCIDAMHIREVLEDIYRVFKIKDTKELEITIEINPGTVTHEKLMTYRLCGINRISFGLQSTKEKELKALGRIHDYETFVRNYQEAREVGFENINIDLMSALPGQSMESFEETLRAVIALQPEHISAYSLIIEEGTPFYTLYGENKGPSFECFIKEDSLSAEEMEAIEKNQGLSLPCEEEERHIYERTKELLHQAGYERYEISNYAKQGYECRHNCSYWTRGEYIGFGTGAASLLHETRFHNCTGLTDYIRAKGNDSRREEKARLSRKEQMEEFMFLGLRMSEGVNKQKFYKEFKQSIEEVYQVVIQTLIKEKLLMEKKDQLFLTEHGVDISNYVMAQFLLE